MAIHPAAQAFLAWVNAQAMIEYPVVAREIMLGDRMLTAMGA